MTTLEWFLIIGLSLYLMVCIAGAWALMYLVEGPEDWALRLTRA